MWLRLKMVRKRFLSSSSGLLFMSSGVKRVIRGAGDGRLFWIAGGEGLLSLSMRLLFLLFTSIITSRRARVVRSNICRNSIFCRKREVHWSINTAFTGTCETWWDPQRTKNLHKEKILASSCDTVTHDTCFNHSMYYNDFMYIRVLIGLHVVLVILVHFIPLICFMCVCL